LAGQYFTPLFQFAHPRIHRCNQLLERLQHSILLAFELPSLNSMPTTVELFEAKVNASGVSVSAVSDVFVPLVFAISMARAHFLVSAAPAHATAFSRGAWILEVAK